MEGTTSPPPPPTSTSSKLVQFHRISNDDDQKSEGATPPNSSFSSHRSLLSCFGLFSSKSPAKRKIPARPVQQERKNLRNSPISRLSLSRMDSSIDASPYEWPHDSSFNPKTTALVIIDMQKDWGYMEYQQYDISPARNIIPKILAILTAFRSHGFPIYHTREGHRPDLSTLSSRELFRSRNNASGLGIGDKGPMGRLLVRGEKGHEIVDELTPLKGENVVDKPGRSAFQHTDLKLMLNIKGIKNLVICGVTTDVCVHSTIREANDNGFDCVLVSDAAAASTGSLHEFALESIKEEGGIFGAVTTSDKVLAALSVGKEEKLGPTTNGIVPKEVDASEIEA